MTTNKTTIVLDASALKNSACSLRIFNDVYMGYRPIGGLLNNDIHFGSAFHKFRAVYRDTNDWDKACVEGVNYYKNREDIHVKDNKKYLTQAFLMSCMLAYEEQYPPNKDTLVPVRDKQGNNLIEPLSRFAFPFIITEDIDILIAGTMDEIAYQHPYKYLAGGYQIVDCKTTGTWKIREYLDSYRLSPQLIMYRWAIKKYAGFHPDSIWAEIDRSPNVGAIIEGVFYASKANEQASVTITRSERAIIFKDQQLVEFEYLLRQYCERLLLQVRAHKANGTTPLREGILNDACNTKFGPCQYTGACIAVDEEQQQAFYEQHFTTKQYNPLQFS